MRFKIGDEVRIVDNLWGHNFKIGDIVEITEASDNDQDYSGRKDDEEYFLCDEELEEIIE